jgi:hypothetical protein
MIRGRVSGNGKEDLLRCSVVGLPLYSQAFPDFSAGKMQRKLQTSCGKSSASPPSTSGANETSRGKLLIQPLTLPPQRTSVRRAL